MNLFALYFFAAPVLLYFTDETGVLYNVLGSFLYNLAYFGVLIASYILVNYLESEDAPEFSKVKVAVFLDKNGRIDPRLCSVQDYLANEFNLSVEN